MSDEKQHAKRVLPVVMATIVAVTTIWFVVSS